MAHDQKEKEKEEKDINRLFFNIMEGYSDSVIPSLSQFSPSATEEEEDQKASSSRKRRCRSPIQEEDNERNKELLKERERRVKMNEMYNALQSLVPNIFPKDSRTKIVGETVEYIKKLEKERERLEELKASSSIMEGREGEGRGGGGGGRISECSKNWKSSVSATVSSSRLVLFSIQSWVHRRLAVEIFMVFERYSAEVLAANITVDQNQLIVSITAIFNGHGDHTATVERIKTDILNL